MRPFLSTLILILSLLIWCCQSIQARIILPAIISDHMVLQQETTVTIWGWTTQTREDIRVWASWGMDTLVTHPQAGRWSVQVKTPIAGGPYSLFILGKDSIEIKDVLVGEVWLGSGQSNMEMSIDRIPAYKEEIKAANFPDIRLFKVERKTSPFPQDDLVGKWVKCSPETIKKYSAVKYFFSKMLHDSLKVPIGSIESSWGGTPADAWTPAPYLLSDSVLAASAEGIQGQSPSPRAPGILYNAMIHPLVRYKIKGITWYQGESNRWRPHSYQRLMLKLIEAWRAEWGEELPFYFVQIAPYDYLRLRGQAGAPYIREAQLQTLVSPHTGMVVTADVGDSTDIHPHRKKEVGERLAYWALAKDYWKKQLVYSGPLFKDYKVVGKKIHIHFDHANEGLHIRGEKLKEIEIAGEDRKFYSAKARIEGKVLIVSSSRVKNPVAVRYGFSDTANMNLYNGAELPASPFRTDNWMPE
ncbi:MAG: sialate O-acetylesterase [Bacteroidia bacterium]|nr:sialate O-acetylesterase [Bacteroidia bacterium]